MTTQGRQQVINQILHRDCLQLFDLQIGADLAIIDPPYNIGFDYGEAGYVDKMSPEDYVAWTHKWLAHVYTNLSPRGTAWVVMGDEYAAETVVAAKACGFYQRSWVIWYYTFGVNCTRKFSRSHAHLLYFTKHRTKFTFNEDAVRIPSARQSVYQDPRANPDGRLPDDTWVIRPQELEGGFDIGSDTWHMPRVAGTFKQREAEAANQLPEQLVARIIRCCSNEADTVYDPMCGTGTVPTVAKKLARSFVGVELDKRFADLARTRVSNANEGQEIA